METFIAFTAQVLVATILATLGVGDLYRQRQLSRYRVVVYPRKARRVRSAAA
jgi:hypothetical protein